MSMSILFATYLMPLHISCSRSRAYVCLSSNRLVGNPAVHQVVSVNVGILGLPQLFDLEASLTAQTYPMQHRVGHKGPYGRLHQPRHR